MKSLPADNIYQRLTDLRNGTGKSQKEVADDLQIPASVLSRIERGETKAVSHDLIIKFSKYYNVSTDYLLCISDIRIRRNVELEELGLTNKALLQLVQGNVDGSLLSKMLEHPEHKIEGQHDIRRLNAEKVTGTEADFEKIKSIFLSMLKDIKKEYDVPQQDIGTDELKKQMVSMKKQALLQNKPSFNEMDMAGIVMGMFRNTGMNLDEYEQELFQKLIMHMLQRKR